MEHAPISKYQKSTSVKLLDTQKWEHAPISGYPVTQPIASNRDNSTIKSFVDTKAYGQQQLLPPSKETDDTVRVILPFRDQISADIVRKQVKDLSLKVHTTIQPVFVSRKLNKN